MCEAECPVGAIVPDNAIPPNESEKWEKINREVSEWGVNITEIKPPMEDHETWTDIENKYEQLGIIPVKVIE